jgi:uncharacterized protein YndB with AHSA1/START domain
LRYDPGDMERSILLPGPAERVWTTITTGLSEWFGARVELEDRPGGRATFRWPDGRERGAVVEEYRPLSRFAFRWLPFERDGGETHLVPSTRVVFDLEEAEGAVQLRVTEEPLSRGRPVTQWGSEPA